MASFFLFQDCRSAAERLLLPYAFALYFCGVSARAVNDSKASEALANGQCLLFRREVYQAIGGHGLVASSVIEDVALAREVKRRNLPSRVLRAEHLGSVRMYDSLTAIWRGFQKNSFRFLLVNPWTGIQVIVASTLLASFGPALAWLLSDRLWVAAAVLTVLPGLALWPWYGSAWALLSPVAIYTFQLIALNAMLRPRAIWKGRRV